MKRAQTVSDLGRAFAALVADASPVQRPAALRACAWYLARTNRLHEAEAVLSVMERELLAREEITLARVESAETLSATEVHRIEKGLGALLRAPVAARVRVRPTVLAGFRAQVNGTLIDASLRGVLSRLRADLRAWTPHLLEDTHHE